MPRISGTGSVTGFARKRSYSVLVVGFPAGPLQANCYVLAAAEGGPCVVVDPGQDALEPLAEQTRKHHLTPQAVLLTHGHFDHAFTVSALCAEHDIPVWIHPDDRYMLSDPARALGPMGQQLFGDSTPMSEPADVRELTAGAELDLAGIRFAVVHTPGHTGGSVCFSAGTDEGGRLLLSGDTLFADAIGRTDLPGGDHERMLHTLRTCVLPLDDSTVVLPGHGQTTTIERERGQNPFLRGLEPAAQSGEG